MSDAIRARKTTTSATSLVLLAGLMTLLGSRTAAATDITSCGTVINQPGDYHLRQHLTCNPASPAAAITVTASNVKLYLHNFVLSGGGTGFAGILVGSFGPGAPVATDVTIQGGTVRDFQFNVILSRVVDSSLVAVNASNTMPTLPGNAITLQRSHGNRVAFCKANRSGFNGINILAGNDNTIVANQTSENAQVGIVIQHLALESSQHNIVRANLSVNNAFVGIKIFDGNTGNVVQANYAAGHSEFDLQDQNATCDNNVWKRNKFGSANQSCIQ